MSQEEIEFLPYDVAAQVVAAIQEEEDVHRENHRVFTVYNQQDKEICWFDFDEVMEEVASKSKETEKEEVSQYILHRIPTWALDV
ncbi:MAG: hypothetical protein OEM02_00820 [Desulfobulbaceae bacterium]|nr:hypothetical protein [Desulfobulbaceae bacterium]